MIICAFEYVIYKPWIVLIWSFNKTKILHTFKRHHACSHTFSCLRSSLASSCCTENIYSLVIFLNFLHWSPAGSHTIENLWWSAARTVSGTDRLENEISCVWKNSLAISGDERTMVVLLPSLSDIKGPYCLESMARERWGLLPTFKRFPMIGKGYGPGGSREWRRWEMVKVYMNAKRQDSKRKRKKVWSSIGLCASLVLFAFVEFS